MFIKPSGIRWINITTKLVKTLIKQALHNTEKALTLSKWTIAIMFTCQSKFSVTFFKFSTTLGYLLFIELMLHLSHVKQMNSQTIHLTHELKSSIQIIGRRVDVTETP